MDLFHTLPSQAWIHRPKPAVTKENLPMNGGFWKNDFCTWMAASWERTGSCGGPGLHQVRSKSPLLWAWKCKDVQAGAALKILFLAVFLEGSSDESTIGKSSPMRPFPSLGWQSSVKVEVMGSGIWQAWLQILPLPLLSAWSGAGHSTFPSFMFLSVKWG